MLGEPSPLTKASDGYLFYVCAFFCFDEPFEKNHNCCQNFKKSPNQFYNFYCNQDPLFPILKIIVHSETV
jgi:hypothetical protein